MLRNTHIYTEITLKTEASKGYSMLNLDATLLQPERYLHFNTEMQNQSPNSKCLILFSLSCCDSSRMEHKEKAGQLAYSSLQSAAD